MADTSALPVPSLTGNPGLDSIIRSGLIAASAAITGVILTWLNAHGFNDPNLSVMIGGAVFAALLALAGAAWGWLKGTQVGQVIASKELIALQAGRVDMAATAGLQKPAPVSPRIGKAIIAQHVAASPPGTTSDDLNEREYARVTGKGL